MLVRQKSEEQNNFSANGKPAADFLPAHPEDIDQLNITGISKAAFTSLSTTVRLSSKLGFAGYKELKKALLDEDTYLRSHFTKIDPNIPFIKQDSFKDIRDKTAVLLVDAVNDTASLIDH